MSTYEQRIQGAIMSAQQRRETEDAAALICHLRSIDPEAAQRIRDAIDEVEARNRARRGADPLWAEHVAEQNSEWWT